MWRESQGVPVQQREDETKECHKGSKSYMQETGYNYSDTNICYPLRKMKNNFKRRTLGSEHGAFSTEGEILTCKEFLLGLAA